MIRLAQNSRECQEHRLKIKTLNQRMQNVAVHGTGLSPWEAKVLVEASEQVYFADPALREASEGQLKYSCVSAGEPPGKKIEDCQMVTVLLTLFDPKDQGQLVYDGKSIRHTELTPVILDLVRSADMVERANGKRLRDMKKEAVARLCKQAFEQDGCLCGAEMAILLKISVPTVGKYIREWEMEHKTVLPRRGSIHDIGPMLTHKKIILYKLFIEQKSVQQTSRETYHSLPAIQRYISTFRQVLLCMQKAMTTEQIAFATGRTKRLIKEYEQIIEEYKKGNYNMKQLLGNEVHIENNMESWIIEYAEKMEQQKN